MLDHKIKLVIQMVVTPLALAIILTIAHIAVPKQDLSVSKIFVIILPLVILGFSLLFFITQLIERLLSNSLQQKLWLKLAYHLGILLVVRYLFESLGMIPTGIDDRVLLLIQWGITCKSKRIISSSPQHVAYRHEKHFHNAHWELGKHHGRSLLQFPHS